MLPRVVAELGINHNGSIDVARNLIEAARRAGVWGVKFQYRNLDNAYAAGARQIGDEILQKEIVRNYLSPESILALTREAQAKGIAAGISFFSTDDFEDFDRDIEQFDFFKVPSAEFTNIKLIRHVESLGKPALISTGAQKESMILEVLDQLDSGIWTPLHCVSNYPVAITGPRLGYIDHLRRLWGGPVGYSSHDDHWEMCLLALDHGASIIERHITLDKLAEGLDHSSSSTPDEFNTLTKFCNNLDIVQAGDGPRVLNQGELINLQNLGRSYYARQRIEAGDEVTASKLVLRSPRTGLGQEEVGPLLGQAALKSLGVGEVVDASVFILPIEPGSDVIEFARHKKLSIPIRFHDMADLARRFPIGRFEFHLSFGDVRGNLDTSGFEKTNRYSVHLPDYISPTRLMDPFSPDPEQNRESRIILERTADFARKLQDLTGETVPIVGSFSVVHDSLAAFFEHYVDLTGRFRADGISILPQWLPPIAWYFGGAVRLFAMNNLEDIALIKKHALPICMDVCHLCMGDKVFDFDAARVVQELAPFTHHVHLAEAAGYDGEGMAFGEGDPENAGAIAAGMAFDCVKVIEVWQGHLHGGAGFAAALIKLKELFGE